MATWEEYTKPKYKDALSRWNKETGGGDGTLPSFYKYACSPWLAWVFCLDSEFDFLLASCSEGRVPSHLDSEGGWEIAPPDSDETDNEKPQTNTKKQSVKQQAKDINKTIATLSDMAVNMSSAVEKITQAMEKRSSSRKAFETPVKQTKITRGSCLAKVNQTRKEQDLLEADPDVTPATKTKSMEMLKKRKKKWMTMALDADSSVGSNDD